MTAVSGRTWLGFGIVIGMWRLQRNTPHLTCSAVLTLSGVNDGSKRLVTEFRQRFVLSASFSTASLLNEGINSHQQRGPEFSSSLRHRDRRSRDCLLTDGFCNYCGTASSKRCFEKSADKCATGPRTVPKSFPL